MSRSNIFFAALGLAAALLVSAPAKAVDVWTNPTVTNCGSGLADPTGATNSTAAIQACLTNAKSVAMPPGNYWVCGVQVTTGRTFVGPGVTVANGAGGGARLFCPATTGDVITITGDQYWIGNFQIDRCIANSPCNPGVTSGAGIGFTGNVRCNYCTIENVYTFNQWNGFALPPADYGTITNVLANNNYNSGFFWSIPNNPGAPYPLQYNIVNIIAQFNNRYGIEAIAQSGAYVPLDTWTGVNTQYNCAGGTLFQGIGSGTINDVHILNHYSSNDVGNGVTFDNVGEHNTMIGGLIEDAGAAAGGRNLSSCSGSTGAGHGIVISGAQNIELIFKGLSIRSNGLSGIATAGGLRNLLIEGNAISANSRFGTNNPGIAIGNLTANVIIANNLMGDAGLQPYSVYTSTPNTILSGNVMGGTAGGCGGIALAAGQKAANIGTGC